MNPELREVVTVIRRLLGDMEDAKVSQDECMASIGLVLARRAKGVPAKEIHQELTGCRGYEKVKADMSKAATVARVFILGLGKTTTDVAQVVKKDGKPVGKGWRRLYDVYTEQVKTKRWTASEGWTQVELGWQHPRYKKTPVTNGKRHLVIEKETGERFDQVAGGTDADTVMNDLLDLSDNRLDSGLVAAVMEYEAAGGTQAALAILVRGRTVKLQAGGKE